MLIQGETVYYDRATINQLLKQGFHLNNDLAPLYHMANYLDKYARFSRAAKQRLKWFDYYRRSKNASQTCRYFGIAPKTFYKWKKRYNPDNLLTLEDQSKAPIRRRQRQITREQESRIIALRKKHICWSKFKLAKVYREEYAETISSWKIQKMIEKHHLYPNPLKTARITAKRLKGFKKKRITELSKKPKAGFLLCLDAVELRVYKLKRFVFTAIDSFSKVAFARMYKNANSYNAADFLNRLLYLLDGRIENIQTDNGSSFEKYFNQGCRRMNLIRFYNRPHTPKDNPVNERFNRTIQDEFINLGNFSPDTVSFNRNLTEWLVEYNFIRPHETLNYQTPIKFNKVLPMYSSSTIC